jgi:glycosyltransferase involved in cell wall biosynthesis
MENFEGKISVIMPAYNEGAGVVAAVSETVRVLEQSGCDHEIVVVDDGSNDDTALAIERAKADWSRVHFVKNGTNNGKGHALLSGYRLASGDLVAFLDADLDLHPNQLDSLYSVMVENGADVVVGSKRHPESQVDYPLRRRIMSEIYYCVTRVLFRLPVRDTQTGIKLFKRQVLDEVFPRIVVKKYAFDLEVLVNACHRNYKIVEAPIQLDFHGKFGRIRFRDIWNMLMDTAAIFYRLHVLKYYDKGAGVEAELQSEAVAPNTYQETKGTDKESELFCS